jgi:hypothetical protein
MKMVIKINERGSACRDGGGSVRREEAATFYLDGLLGFLGAYDKFREASEPLCEKDRLLIESAVASGNNKGVILQGNDFLWN